MMTRWFPAVAAACGLALVAAACADPVAPAAPTPATPTITDVYNGTLVVQGLNTLPFHVNELGGIAVTLSRLDPAATVGLGLGTLNNGTCTLLQNNRSVQASDTAQITGTATTAGDFCLELYDTGTLTAPVAFTISVLHP
jgi:hypothetical protein